MLCPTCGSELSDDAPFCLTCSTFVETEESPAPRYAAADDPIADLLHHGRAAEALAQCRQAVQMSPEDGDLYARLGSCYQALGQSRAALEAYKQALRCHPTDPAAVRRQLDAVIDALRAPGQAAPAPAAPVELRGGTRFTPAPPPEPTPAVRRLRRAFFIAVVVLAFAIIGASVYAALRPRGAAPPPPRQVVPLPLGNETPRAISR